MQSLIQTQTDITYNNTVNKANAANDFINGESGTLQSYLAETLAAINTKISNIETLIENNVIAVEEPEQPE